MNPTDEFYHQRLQRDRINRKAIRKSIGLKYGEGWSVSSVGTYFLLDEMPYDVYSIINIHEIGLPTGLPKWAGCRREDGFVRLFSYEETIAMMGNGLSKAIID